MCLRSPLRILFHMHSEQKHSPYNAIYLPMFLLRNQLMSIFLVMFSINSNWQILSCGAVLVTFTIYSLLYCPYTSLMRLGLHISELLFIVQLTLLFFTTSIEYGNAYYLPLMGSNENLYSFAWALVSINYVQIIILTVLAFFILVDLSRTKICRKN